MCLSAEGGEKKVEHFFCSAFGLPKSHKGPYGEVSIVYQMGKLRHGTNPALPSAG